LILQKIWVDCPALLCRALLCVTTFILKKHTPSLVIELCNSATARCLIHSLTRTHSHLLTLAHTHSHLLTLTHTHSHSLTLTHTHSHSLTNSHSLKPTRTHSQGTAVGDNIMISNHISLPSFMSMLHNMGILPSTMTKAQVGQACVCLKQAHTNTHTHKHTHTLTCTHTHTFFLGLVFAGTDARRVMCLVLLCVALYAERKRQVALLAGHALILERLLQVYYAHNLSVLCS